MSESRLLKRVKELRKSQGLSQEELAEKTGLSLRTIQRLEKGDTEPRGDTLKRLSIALNSSPDDLIEWQVYEDKNVLKMLSLSQLTFLVFPLLGVIIPMAIWILQKDKVKHVDVLGKAILNFQITWVIALFTCYGCVIVDKLYGFFVFPFSWKLVIFWYAYNLIVAIGNTLLISEISRTKYIPAFRLLK